MTLGNWQTVAPGPTRLAWAELFLSKTLMTSVGHVLDLCNTQLDLCGPVLDSRVSGRLSQQSTGMPSATSASSNGYCVFLVADKNIVNEMSGALLKCL